MRHSEITVVGGGMAGAEAAWQLARRGVFVTLVEGKPGAISPAHSSPLLAEIVCSNSFRSDDATSPPGMLKAELRRAGSLILACADATRVPAGDALAVERHAFARLVTTRIAMEPRIRLERRPVEEWPAGPVIVATGPLTGDALARLLAREVGATSLYFYDAIAPIVDADTIDLTRAFRQSRWGKGDGDDYLNAPMTHDEYRAFVEAVRDARKISPHAFEEARYFEGCIPIEVMAERGDDVLAFGPMRPVGLVDPASGARPHAVVQLRLENRHRTAYNLVGFQTRMAYPDQKRVFRLIPALREAEFLRFGSIHRNTYLDAPRLLGPELELRARPDVRVAGLLCGVEGYIESCAMGLCAAIFAAARLRGRAQAAPPDTTALGALLSHVTRMRGVGEVFQPANIHFGLLPPLPDRATKRERRLLHAKRAERDIAPWLKAVEA